MARDQESLKQLVDRRDAAYEAREECSRLEIPDSLTGWGEYGDRVQREINRRRLRGNVGLGAVVRRIFGRQP